METNGCLEDFGTCMQPGDESEEVPTCSKEPSEHNRNRGMYNFIQWTNLGDGIYTHTGHTQKTLDSAAYTIFANNRGIFLRKETLNSDELIEFEDSIIDGIIKEIEVFWESKKVYDKYGFLHRRGYLFYGIAGCGKSAIIYLIINKVIERKGLVLICNDPSELSEMVKIIRMIEPHRHIVVVLEDIDAIIRKYGEDHVLSFLDGESQADDILNLATTNYPERLDKRIVKRPRRFDRRLLISSPSASIRREFFIKKLGVKEKDIEMWVSASKDFTFAGMTELVVRVKALKIDFDLAVKEIRELILGVSPASDAFNKTEVGFRK